MRYPVLGMLVILSTARIGSHGGSNDFLLLSGDDFELLDGTLFQLLL